MRFEIRKFIRDIYAIRREKTYIPVEHRTSFGDEFGRKTAWILGKSCGIGLVIVKTILASGCNVIISGINKKIR